MTSEKGTLLTRQKELCKELCKIEPEPASERPSGETVSFFPSIVFFFLCGTDYCVTKKYRIVQYSSTVVLSAIDRAVTVQLT